jgi:hypothetical protein
MATLVAHRLTATGHGFEAGRVVSFRDFWYQRNTALAS